MIRLLGISGSLRQGSVSKKMVEKVLEAAKTQPGVTTDLIDLSQFPSLPFSDGRANMDDSYGPVVNDLRKRVEAADGFVVGTPEYHGGYSGALKNFLDLQCGHSFKDKWVALVGAAGGRLGADQSLNQLRVVFKNLDAFTWKNQTSVGGSDVNKQGEITNEGVSKRLKAMGEELAALLKRLKQGPQE